MDEQAKKNEVERMLSMPAMAKSSREEVEQSGGYTIHQVCPDLEAQVGWMD